MIPQTSTIGSRFRASIQTEQFDYAQAIFLAVIFKEYRINCSFFDDLRMLRLWQVTILRTLPYLIKMR